MLQQKTPVDLCESPCLELPKKIKIKKFSKNCNGKEIPSKMKKKGLNLGLNKTFMFMSPHDKVERKNMFYYGMEHHEIEIDNS